MKNNQNGIRNVDEYILGFPEETQKILNQIRLIIIKMSPDVEEIISYQMPAYKFKGILVYLQDIKIILVFILLPQE